MLFYVKESNNLKRLYLTSLKIVSESFHLISFFVRLKKINLLRFFLIILHYFLLDRRSKICPELFRVSNVKI